LIYRIEPEQSYSSHSMHTIPTITMNKVSQKIFFIALFLMLTIPNTCGQENLNELFKLSENQFKKGNYAEALNYEIKALKVTEKTPDNKGLIAMVNIRVGRMYYFLQEKRLALSCFFTSRRLVMDHKIDSLRFRVAYNIGVIYTELMINDSALIYYNEAKKGLPKNADFKDLAKLHGVVADLYLNNIHNYDLARYHIVEAEKYAEKSNDISWKAFVCIKYSIYYKLIKNYALCLKYAQKAYRLYEKTDETDNKIYGLRVLVDAMTLNSNPEIKVYYDKLLILKDSIFKVETANKIGNYKTLYETEKKEAENQLLLQKNKLNESEIEAKNKTILGLIVGVLLIIILVLWRVNINSLKKKNRELEAAQAIQKEKERISRDLHDNVGGQLSYVLYSLDGVNEENKQKRLELTATINESIRNVIGSLRETIWAINDESMNLHDFSDKLKVYTRSMFRNTNTSVVFHEQINQDKELNSVTGLNLYRICQEIINNAFKHSKADELKVEVIVNDYTTVVISDNGVGFDLDHIGRHTFGLENIKGRATEAGINLHLNAEINKGVVYRLLV